jgi:methylthioribose-1-phosphate isomerase
MIRPIFWRKGEVAVLDQRLLPRRTRYLRCRTVEQLARAIETLAIRGAPLIGIAGAYGLALGVWRSSPESVERDFQRAEKRIARTRPTAVNLFWALGRMERRFRSLLASGAEGIARKMLAEARRIHADDAALCTAIGKHGAGLIKRGSAVLTHCNTGALATGGIGTALGIIATAWRRGRVRMVYVDETRPLLQGARLTMWELGRLGIPATLVCDNMAAGLMAAGLVDCVIVGADRIADNGDFANKTGTYGLAVLARHHRVPFYVAAPTSTVDPGIRDRSGIPIEHRREQEVTTIQGRPIAGVGASAFNPAFDVTPANLVTALVTERGIMRRPFVSLRKRLSL